MDVYISIDGVLRNIVDKFDYHYKDAFVSETGDFDSNLIYGIKTPVCNDNLLNYYNFNDKKEYENFLYLEYPVEIFGHSFPSYPNVFLDLNKIIYDNNKHNFHLVGLNEYGKARPATLFFLSKCGYLGNSIKFINSSDIKKEWKKCDIWLTDNESILNLCPKNKLGVKYNTKYNQYFTADIQINKINEINDICHNFLTKTTS